MGAVTGRRERKIAMRMLVLWSALAAVCVPAAAVAEEVVTVHSGRIRGVTEDGVTAFKGVPFAQPPVGDLRWREPQPVRAWTSILEANAYGNDCQQTPFPSDAAPLGAEPAEDCLYLNVWIPETAEEGDDLPVMFWIHGGGFVNGGSSPEVYSGENFARDGVILVSANHRLGRFGFFAHPALSAEQGGAPKGNFAIMDQIAALEWIQRNIESFGGDPDNVTVFGESAGGFSVHYLMTTSAADGLFDKAIIESGGGRDRPTPSFVEAERRGVEIAQSLGVEGEGPEALAALRALDAETLEGGLSMATMGRVATIGPMQDSLLPVQPADVYESGGAAPVPVLVGANDADSFFFGGDLEAAYGPFGGRSPAAEALYDPEGTGDAAAVGTRISSDMGMNEPARYVASVLSGMGQPVWLYRFSYVAESIRDQSPHGAAHATEIPFVFDTVDAKYGDALTDTDARVAAETHAYWVAFAKMAEMALGGLPSVPQYDPDDPVIVEFTEDGPVVGPDPIADRLDFVKTLAGSSD